DLAPLALELAQWGAQEATDLPWLDLPPAAAMAQARSLLCTLGLMDERQQLTAQGKAAHELGVEPRIAAMLLAAQAQSPAHMQSALALAALLEEPERQVLDVQHSLHRWQQGKHNKARTMNQRATALAHKLDDSFDLRRVDTTLLSVVACLAFPDRIAQQRGQHGQFLLANGHGAFVADDQPLAGSDYLIALDLMRGHQQSSQVFSALELDIGQLEQQCPQLFNELERVDWDDKAGRLVAEMQLRCGQLVIRRQALPAPNKQKMTQALLNYVERKGLSVLNW
ncbi:ATP-dependent RNA helicase HrpB, partial [Vibrio fluvialis]|nr:ATP-dependent RNA helicase HrpB [Vibrio fluvialis]